MKTRDNATATSVATPETDSAKRIRRTFNDAADQAIKDAEAANQGVNVHVHLGGNATTDAKPAKTDDADPVTLLTKTVATVADSVAALSKQVAKLVKGNVKVVDKADDDDEEDDEEGKPKKTDDDDGEEMDEEGKPKKKTEDSRALETAFKDTLAGVEILSPGLKLSTFDAKTSRTQTVASLCRMRGRALDRFTMTPAGTDVVTKLLDGKTYDSVTLDCRDTAKLFKSAVAVQKAANNTSSVGDQAFRLPGQSQQGFVISPGRGNYAPTVPTAFDINERNKKYWESQGVKS